MFMNRDSTVEGLLKSTISSPPGSMAGGRPCALNLYEDHERWEEYKYQTFLFPERLNSELTVAGESVEGEQGSRTDRVWSELNSRRMKPRRTLLRKEGQSNIAYRGIQKKKVKFLKDLYVTLLDLKWRWAMLILFLGFFLLYFFFSILYFLMSYTHGDITHAGDPNFTPCIYRLDSYWDALLFSIETQSTIGYGTIYPNADCAGTLPVVYLQITCGFLLETVLLGFIFVKIARPKHRRHTLIFSRNACICLEDQHLNLQIRVGDIRNSHLIDCHVYGALVKRYVCQEKYVYPLFQHEIEFHAHNMKDKVFLIWPMVLSHKITKDSPLYTLTPEDLIYDKFELIVVLEGTIESTGEMVQARTSFTSKEILWGHRFTRVEEYDEKTDKWCINFVRFNNVVPSKTPKCNAKDLTENPERVHEVYTEEDPVEIDQLTRQKHTLATSVDTLDTDAVYSTASEDDQRAEDV
ncbi:ATP-sensitive inward rectifier potassium channel 12 [Biomphalaria pfeifferi]|uniref:ATP-sensitive inward rectifier potassium channel 12 n=1 Tax=Biomphalaria pfeifferi TaxID=112525 RepID=A0AAD8C9P3_BIOPF|nr:ATP-sensitive inward rectifier potassium channel 12 [Biomphalaria pfeifferi]